MTGFRVIGIFMALAPLVAVAQTAQRCRVLSLGGGGDRGAFEAGAISALASCLPPGEAEWDVVSGISAGSINAVAVSQFPRGEEAAVAGFVTQSWSQLNHSDVWKEWDTGIFSGWKEHSGLLDSSPELALLKRLINATAVRDSGRSLILGSTRLDDGHFETFNETFADIHTAVMASSAIPGVFPMVKIGANHYVDGGMNYRAPVSGAVARCRERFPGIPDSAITIDVALAIGSGSFAGPLPDNAKTPEVLLRTVSDLVKDRFIKDIQNVRQAYPDIKMLVVEPKTKLPGFMLGFIPAELKEMIKLGYAATLQTGCKRT